MIRTCASSDLETTLTATNDGVRTYHGVIPAGSLHSPCMSHEELPQGIAQGIRFYLYKQADEILGVIGIQNGTCWTVPARQMETSAVLADQRGKDHTASTSPSLSPQT